MNHLALPEIIRHRSHGIAAHDPDVAEGLSLVCSCDFLALAPLLPLVLYFRLLTLRIPLLLLLCLDSEILPQSQNSILSMTVQESDERRSVRREEMSRRMGGRKSIPGEAERMV